MATNVRGALRRIDTLPLQSVVSEIARQPLKARNFRKGSVGKVLNAYLKGDQGMKDTKVAMKAMKWLRSVRGAEMVWELGGKGRRYDVEMYSLLLSTYARSAITVRIDAVVREMKEKQVPMDLECHIAILQSLTKSETSPELPVYTYYDKHLTREGYPRHPIATLYLMRVTTSTPAAHAMLRTVESEGKSTPFHRAAYLRCLGRYGDVEDAEEYFKEADCRGSVIFNEMLRVYSASGRHEAMKRLFSTPAHLTSIDPSSFVIYIESLTSLAVTTRAFSKYLPEVSQLWFLARHEGHATTPSVYSAMMTFYYSVRDLEEAGKLHHQYVQYFAPKYLTEVTVTYCKLLWRTGHKDEARKVADMFEASNL